MGLVTLLECVFRVLCDFTPSRRRCTSAHTSARQMATYAISSTVFRVARQTTRYVVSLTVSTLVLFLTQLFAALKFPCDSTQNSNGCVRDFIGPSDRYLHGQHHTGSGPGHFLTAVELFPKFSAVTPVRSCCMGARSSKRASARSRRRARKRTALLHSLSILKTQRRRSSRRLGRRRRRKRRHTYYGVNHVRARDRRLLSTPHLLQHLCPLLVLCPSDLRLPPTRCSSRHFSTDVSGVSLVTRALLTLVRPTT